MSSVWDGVPGQEAATSFLRLASHRPHHAYLLSGPEGGGKQQAARAFAAALLCEERGARGESSPGGVQPGVVPASGPHDEELGCGECRACTLALAERHPNVFVVEPEGRDIHVETVREEVWHPAYRTAPEPGRKVFVVREADRLNPSAADVLLKVLEEPPADAVLLLLSARPDEIPETVVSRCHVVSFVPLPEPFVTQALAAEGVEPGRAALSARLAGGNLGRARRLTAGSDGLAFRDVAVEALELIGLGPPGALKAAEVVLAAGDRFRKAQRQELEEELAPFVDDRGRAEDAFRGVVRRIEERHKRQERRAERTFVDWVLLAVTSLLRDRVLVGRGGRPELAMNLDMDAPAGSARVAVMGMGIVEEARAALADETNLNVRLVLENAFLRISAAA